MQGDMIKWNYKVIFTYREKLEDFNYNPKEIYKKSASELKHVLDSHQGVYELRSY